MHGAVPRPCGNDRQVVGGELLRDVIECGGGVADNFGQPSSAVLHGELSRDRGATQVGVDQQDARIVGSARERAGQIDGRQRLTLARRRAGDRDHLQRAVAAEAFNREAQALVLFRRERARRGQRHQMRVESSISMSHDRYPGEPNWRAR